MNFYIGLHQPSDAKRFDKCLISINRLKTRKSDFQVNNWMMDSGAFTELKNHQKHRLTREEYAAQIKRWSNCGNLVAAACQDYLPGLTGHSMESVQRRTLGSFSKLTDLNRANDSSVYIMPVLQGTRPEDYRRHLELYLNHSYREYFRDDEKEWLQQGAMVGVGSLVRISSQPDLVEEILSAILELRPDLRLHGFGLKLNAFKNPKVVEALATADSIAWSLDARRAGRNANCWKEAVRYNTKVKVALIKSAA